MGSLWYTIVVDAADPPRLARWWGEVLRYDLIHDSPEEAVITSGTKGHPGMCFVLVTEGKNVKNRLHIDLNPDDRDAEVERLVNMGARHVDVGQKDVPWVVLADPEGNEFCVLTPR